MTHLSLFQQLRFTSAGMKGTRTIQQWVISDVGPTKGTNYKCENSVNDVSQDPTGVTAGYNKLFSMTSVI